jgi:hypothetical protein
MSKKGLVMYKAASYHHRQGEQLMAELLEKEAAFPLQRFAVQERRLAREHALRVAMNMSKKHRVLRGERLIGAMDPATAQKIRANLALPLNVSGGRTMTKAIKDSGQAAMDRYRLLGAKQIKG